MNRRPSMDYNLLAVEKVLQVIKKEPDDMKDREILFQKIRGYIDSYIKDNAPKLSLAFKPCLFVGSMVDGTCVGVPKYDLLLPINMESVTYTEPSNGRVQINIEKTKNEEDNFLTDGKVSPEKVYPYVMEIVKKAIEYYSTLPGNLDKHKVLYTDGYEGRMNIRLQDKRTGEVTVVVTVAGILSVSHEGVMAHAQCGPTSWMLNHINLETNLVLSWDKAKNNATCQQNCLRILKAILQSQMPKIPSYTARAIVIAEVLQQGHDASWTHDELPSRCVDIIKRLQAGLKSGEVMSFDGKIHGAARNVLDGVKSSERTISNKKLGAVDSGIITRLVSQVIIKHNEPA